MIIAFRDDDGDFTDPMTVSGGASQEVCYAVSDSLSDGYEYKNAPSGSWTPKLLLEKSGITAYKLVPMSTDELLAHDEINNMLQEMANDRNSK